MSSLSAWSQRSPNSSIQAWAGPAHNAAAVRRDDHLGADEKESHDGGWGGYGGDDKGYDDQGEWEDYNGDYYKPEEAKPAGNVVVTITQWATVTAPAPEQKNVAPTTVCLSMNSCERNSIQLTQDPLGHRHCHSRGPM